MIKRIVILLLSTLMVSAMHAQTDWWRLLSGTLKAGQAMVITDEQLAEIVREQVKEMDSQNKVCSSNNKYSKRLKN